MLLFGNELISSEKSSLRNNPATLKANPGMRNHQNYGPTNENYEKTMHHKREEEPEELMHERALTQQEPFRRTKSAKYNRRRQDRGMMEDSQGIGLM